MYVAENAVDLGRHSPQCAVTAPLKQHDATCFSSGGAAFDPQVQRGFQPVLVGLNLERRSDLTAASSQLVSELVYSNDTRRTLRGCRVAITSGVRWRWTGLVCVGGGQRVVGAGDGCDEGFE